MLTDDQRTRLSLLADRVLPPEHDSPGAAEAGAVDFVERLLETDRASDAPALLALLDSTAPDESSPAFRLLVELVHEAYWGSLAGRAAVGFADAIITPVRSAPLPPVMGDLAGKEPPITGGQGGRSQGKGVMYDAIVIGAGAGGGVVAGLLAEAGKRVLLLERGGNPSYAEVGHDPLRNQRLSVYGHNAGPGDEHPREAGGRKVLPWEGGYHANAALVGGGTRVWGAQAWRFHPLDFKMATTYGVPVGSSLADWPLTREELDPFYARAEREIGVCGERHPMPPQPITARGAKVMGALESLGWARTRVPLAINSRPHLGRPACVRCSWCVGFACPSDAKNGSHNTLIPRGLLTGKLDLVTGAMTAKIHHEGGSHATGVTYFVGDEERFVQADVIIIAGGAIESARLLLLSGIGGEHVGRHLQGHVYTGAVGLYEENLHDGLGPGVTTATVEWSHGNDGVVGGGMLADEFVPLPLYSWKRLTPPDVPRVGMEAKRWLRENYGRLVQLHGPVQDIPSPDGRVTLSDLVRDRWGLPVAKLSGATHPETVRTAQFLHSKAVAWHEAAGAKRIWGGPPTTASLSGGQHQAGTCRMSADPALGVVDPNNRVHGFDNLYVADGSVHVTNGGFNPALTIFALAFRLGQHLKESW